VNTEVLFSSKTDLHTTPDDLFFQLHHEFHFTLDAAADASNAKCLDFMGPGSEIAEDALAQPWPVTFGAVWCNPPYGRQTAKWLERGWEAVQKGHTFEAVFLLPARPGTKWFHEYAFREGVERRWLKGRLKFGNPENKGNCAPFDSIILVFRAPKWFGPHRWRVG
jgi:phage N-6-adenine-methyltransferase